VFVAQYILHSWQGAESQTGAAIHDRSSDIEVFFSGGKPQSWLLTTVYLLLRRSEQNEDG
jgi:hypothetical protein